MGEFRSIEYELGCINQNITRILKHQEQIYTYFEKLEKQDDALKKDLNEETLARVNGDNDIKQKCQEDRSSVYKAVAGTALMSFIGLIVWLVQYSLGTK